MAIKKEIDLIVNKEQAEKNLKSVTSEFDILQKKAKEIEAEMQKTTDPEKLAVLKNKLKEVNSELGKTKKVTDKVADSTKKANKGTSLLSRGFKGLGVAIKATGIGLLVSLVAGLTVAFSKNQKVMNAVNTVFETVNIVLSKVANALVNVYEYTTSASENFNGLAKVLKGLITVGITPLKLAFQAIKLSIQQGQLAWEKSFFGGKDKDKIKELNEGIAATQKAIVEVGKEALQGGKDIYNNFSDAVGEVVAIGSKASEELSKISVKSAIEQAKVNVELKNTAQLAVAQQILLVEKYDILAEKQRQIRDEERNSITDRIKANNDLKNILDSQEKAMLSGANAVIASAQAELDKNNTIENQVALTDALANKQGVLAQIEGFRSEQLANDLALKREEIELNNTLSDAEKERQLAKLDFDAEQAETEAKKLEIQQKKLDLENEIILADIERKRELFKEGTQARVDAEVDYANRYQELQLEQIELDKKVAEDKKRIEDELAEDKKRIEQEVADAKENIANRTLALITELAGKGSKLSKAIAVAQTIRSGIEGVQNAYTTAQKSPITTLFPAYPVVQAGLAGAFSAIQVKKILSSKDIGGDTSGSASGGGSAPTQSAPSFNLVQGTQSNQIAESVNASANKPIETFVVSSSVTTAQEADRNRIEESSI